MARYKVVQEVQCVVRVWYELERDTMEEVLDVGAWNTTPTDRSMDGADYEIISDDKITLTKVEMIDDITRTV